MTEGIRVAALDDIAEGEGLAVSKDVTGTEDDIAILRDEDGSVWALNDTCTHETASLADGWVEDGHVECPLHCVEVLPEERRGRRAARDQGHRGAPRRGPRRRRLPVPERTTLMMNDLNRVVIVGGGIGGVATAARAALRRVRR